MLPASCEHFAIERILARHRASQDSAALPIENMKRSLDYFSSHAIGKSMTAEDAQGFHH